MPARSLSNKVCPSCGQSFRPRNSATKYCAMSCARRNRKGRAPAQGGPTPLYKHPLGFTWRSMVRRCTAPTCDSYEHYGARGIRVCDAWLSFWKFAADIDASIGQRPEGQTIDRIDTDGHYEPGNVRWATRTAQLRNQRRNRVISFGDQERCLSEWAELYGLNKSSLTYRLDAGWPIELALTAPSDRRIKHHNKGVAA